MTINRLKSLTAISTVFAATISLSLPAVAQDEIRLKFGVYSSNKPTAMVRTFKPILNALEAKMSERLNKTVDIRMQIAKSYEQGVSDLTNGSVDFSRFGPASYIEAKRENSGVKIVAMESQNNEKVFYGIIAVNENSTITELDQIKGKSFAFGNETSTIGRYLSQLFLEKNGIRAGDLKDYQYLGRHDKVGTAVGAGDFDAGALNESTFKKLTSKGEPIKELARFTNASKPWIARAGIDTEVFEALQASLLELKDPDTLKSLKVDGFLSGDDNDYQTIRDSIDLNDLFFSDKPTVQAGIDHAPISVDNNGQSIQINIRFKNSEGGNTSGLQDSANPIVVDVLIDGTSDNTKVLVTQSND